MKTKTKTPIAKPITREENERALHIAGMSSIERAPRLHGPPTISYELTYRRLEAEMLKRDPVLQYLHDQETIARNECAIQEGRESATVWTTGASAELRDLRAKAREARSLYEYHCRDRFPAAVIEALDAIASAYERFADQTRQATESLKIAREDREAREEKAREARRAKLSL